MTVSRNSAMFVWKRERMLSWRSAPRDLPKRRQWWAKSLQIHCTHFFPFSVQRIPPINGTPAKLDDISWIRREWFERRSMRSLQRLKRPKRSWSERRVGFQLLKVSNYKLKCSPWVPRRSPAKSMSGGRFLPVIVRVWGRMCSKVVAFAVPEWFQIQALRPASQDYFRFFSRIRSYLAINRHEILQR